MYLRRSSLALVTAAAIALSALPSVAGAQENGTPPPAAEAEQWPGSVEGSSMLSSGEIPQAPSFGSSDKDDEEEDENGGMFDENGNIPVIGSISLPGWVAIPIGILQAGMAITGAMASGAHIILSLHPDGPQILRNWLISVGINPDA